MKLIIKFSGNVNNLMRQLGYHPAPPWRGEARPLGRPHEPSFMRRLSAADYPRFHAYVSHGTEQEVIVNIHLDQKKPIYRGTSAHSGEYDGELVEREAERIKQMSAQ